MKKNAKGFTLIELLVVVAIIGILAAILVPGLMDKTTDAKITSANKNAQNVYSSSQTLMQEAIIEEVKFTTIAEGTTLVAEGQNGKAHVDLTADTSIKDAIAGELGTNFKGYWYVEFDDDCNTLYALWSAKSAPSAGQLDEAKLKEAKGKVGCHPVKD